MRALQKLLKKLGARRGLLLPLKVFFLSVGCHEKEDSIEARGIRLTPSDIIDL